MPKFESIFACVVPPWFSDDGHPRFLKIRVLKMRELNLNDEQSYNGEYRTWLVTVSAPARTPSAFLRKALNEEFDTRCTHPYDCCGCRYYSAGTNELRRSKSGEWTFPLYSHVNV